MFVLETREHAEARGAKPLARIAGYGRRYESATASYRPTGQSIGQAIEAALASAGVRPDAIGHVSAHGLSTELDDRIEAEAIRRTLGDVPVTALKSYMGNVGATCGAVELALTLLGLQRGKVAATLNYETPDPKCPVNVVTELAAARSPLALLLNHRTTGQAVSLLVEAE